MASSIDKLKELTSKLEDRLVEKRGYYQNAPLISKYSKHISKKKEVVIEAKIDIKNKEEHQSNIEIIEESPSQSTPTKSIRRANIDKINLLYKKLKIFEKSPDFNNIFVYKAMNLSGIGLKDEDFGEVRAGKYIQVIAITYEPDNLGKKKAKNISLGYFGKGETIDPELKNQIIEFVLRWRYEKAFQNVQHYKELISKLD
jgi:hypothetical protein